MWGVRQVVALLAGAWLVLILAATLGPGSSHEPSSLPVICLICGERGGADAVLNVALFAPLGFLLARLGYSSAPVIGVLALLSTGIELSQWLVPGRFPTLADIVFNSLGGALGARAGPGVGGWLRGSGPGNLAVASLASTGLLALVAVLFHPSSPGEDHFVGWVPRLGHLEHYQGQVQRVSLNGGPMEPGRLSGDRLRGELSDEWILVVDFVVGEPPDGLAPFVSVFDEEEREILLVGTDEEDVVVRRRLRADDFGFDHPDVRWEDGMASLTTGERVALKVATARHETCIQLGGRLHCERRASLHRGWSLLWYDAGMPPSVRVGLDVFWVAGLFGLVGCWARRRSTLLVGLLPPILALVILPVVSGLVWPPGWTLAAAVGAAVAAGEIGGWIRRAG